ncbi:hypothetical protein GCM10009069_15600 [Algimonas arctica]|uniref:17 kDa surface antigen n=1 Tax=Algimonas arctica TaxID=1479486 RepID=A0A8J3CQU8_9PROT|nr:glycine zipper 2TM domain-containing protein [Algimonas arctica]GHA93414.1 hypothetical protein GCM10009069_15600 [Algimonas arctica]
MKQFTKSLAVASVAAAAFALPATASASDYRKCKDTQAAIAGGLIGGSLGTVLGEEIAGRNDKTEGAIAGALIGGIIGAAIGDGASDCEKDDRTYRNNRVISTAHTPTYQTAQYHGRQNNTRGYQQNQRGYNNRGQNNRGYNDRGYGNQRGYNAQQHDQDLRQIDRRMSRLRAERDDLKRAQRYQHGRRGIQRRLNEISYQLDALKDERRQVKRAWDNRRQPRGHQTQTRRGHYHGQTVCYSDH